MRPALVRVIRPASDSTSRCFITAGSDIGSGAASSLTERRRAAQPGDQRPPRRVGERGEGAVERGGRIVNHMVKYSRRGGRVKGGGPQRRFGDLQRHTHPVPRAIAAPLSPS